MDNQIPSAVTILSEYEAYRKLHQRQLITQKDFEQITELSKGLVAMCMGAQFNAYNEIVKRIEAFKKEKMKVVPAEVQA